MKTNIGSGCAAFRRIIAFVLVVMLVSSLTLQGFAAPTVETYTGAAGDSATWTLRVNKSSSKNKAALTISGSGKVTVSARNLEVKYGVEINTVEVKSGITEIGDYAFAHLYNCYSVSLPSSLVTIGKSAFAELDITFIEIPRNVTSIGSGAFADCFGLEMVYIASPTVAKGFAYEDSFGGLLSHTNMVYIKSGIEDLGTYLADNFAYTDVTVTYNGTTYRKYIVCDHDPYRYMSDYNDYAHWLYCPTCMAMDPKEVHYFDNPCDPDCNEAWCNFTRVTEHHYAATYTADETGHWYSCEGCGLVKDFAEHQYADIWSADGEGHWYECVICKFRKDYADHVYDNNQDKECNICLYAAWDGTTQIFQLEYNAYGELVYEIDTAQKLAYLAQQCAQGKTFYGDVFELTKDIYLNDETFTFLPDTGLVEVTDGRNVGYLGTGIKGDGSGSNTVFDKEASEAGVWYQSPESKTKGAYSGVLYEWTAIAGFLGRFEGRNYTIHGLYINQPNANVQGLFGAVGAGGIVMRVQIDNTYVCGKDYVGAVAGKSEGNVAYCGNQGVVLGDSTVGGIVGWAEAGTVSYGYNTGIVSGSGTQVGGIAGYGNVSYSYNAGLVMGSQWVGGLAGKGRGDCSYSFNMGTVIGQKDYVGGIIGAGSVRSVYNIGKVYCQSTGGSLGFISGTPGEGNKEDAYYLDGSYLGINGTNDRNVADYIKLSVNQLKDMDSFYSFSFKTDGGGRYDWVMGESSDYSYPVPKGVTMVHKHQWEYSYNSVYHWNECVVCHESQETGKHISTGDHVATCVSKGVCDICGVLFTDPLEHNYIALETDGENHWYVCECGATTEPVAHTSTGDNVASCYEQAVCDVCLVSYGPYMEHTYSIVCDETCDVCGDNRTVENHSYDSDCDEDCNLCGKERTITHTYDHACDESCNICGYVREVGDHSYTRNSNHTCDICKFSKKPDAPTVESKSYDRVTLVVMAGFEYSMDGITWQNSNVFANLAENTDYTFYQRVKASDAALVSEMSEALVVRTDVEPVYTVTFVDWDGTVLSVETYHWGDAIVVPPAPTRAADNTYTYAFAGWDRNVVACAGDATYTATYYIAAYVEYTVVFKDWDGSVISSRTYHYGDVLEAPADPTKAADNTYTYTFAGWDQEVVACEGNATYTATYTATYIEYTVVFMDWDGTVLSTKTYHYGDPIEAPDDPSQHTDHAYIYTFVGWDQEVGICIGDVVYGAIYAATYIEYTVVFLDWDGTVLSSQTYHYAERVAVPADPARAADHTYTYTFAGWDQAVVLCEGDATYTATYDATYIEYMVVFKDWDGSVITTQTYHYGDAVAEPVAPAKAADNTYTYTFTGWDQEVVACAGDATYTATYTATYIEYTVVFKDWDGSVISSQTYHWGEKVVAPANPTREEDENGTYTFAGWDQEVVACKGDATYTATYTTASILLGDVNGDGRINARDARALLRYLAGLAEDSEIDMAAADFNADGRINARDARAILRFIAGLDG